MIQRPNRREEYFEFIPNVLFGLCLNEFVYIMLWSNVYDPNFSAVKIYFLNSLKKLWSNISILNLACYLLKHSSNDFCSSFVIILGNNFLDLSKLITSNYKFVGISPFLLIMIIKFGFRAFFVNDNYAFFNMTSFFGNL